MANERLLGDAGMAAINTATDPIGGIARMLGWTWRTNTAGQVVKAGYVRILNGETQFVAGTKWQIWTAAGVRLQNIEIGGGIVSGAAGDRVAVPGVAQTALTSGVDMFVTIYHPSTQTGNYWFQSGFGNITIPPRTKISGENIFRNGGTVDQPPNDSTFTNGAFAVDVEIGDATSDASAGLAAGSGSALGATVTVTTTPTTAMGVGQALAPTLAEEGDVHLYTFGPCEPWSPIWNCNISLLTGAPEVTGVAIQAASEVLYHLSAQRFGLCNVKLRPCRKSCQSGFPWWSWWEYGSYPQPYWWNGTWYNLACNSCPDNSCSCVGLAETDLPGPVVSITEVKLNGVILTPGVDYRVDDYRKLVRLGGDPWPFCQNLNLADTENDTWSVTAQYGEIVPVLGRIAVGELGLEFVKYLLCEDDCQLPFGVVDVSRQGISMTMQNTAELIKQGIINLPMCALFIQAANPEHLTARAAVYDLDAPSHRAVGT